MFNLSEKAPLVLFGVLAIVHIFKIIAPNKLLALITPWVLLTPISNEALSLKHNMISLLGHGFFHADFMHLITNGFMMVAFGVVTLVGLRAKSKTGGFSSVQQFYLIFILGVIGGGIFQWGWWSITNTSVAAALGASGGAAALFATMAYALGGKERMMKFGLGWLVANIAFALIGPSVGMYIAWAAHLGGYALGMIIAPYWVKPKSTSFRLN